jgi:hypothetical protein
MSSIGRGIGAFAVVGALCVGLSRNVAAQMADTTNVDTTNVVTIETVDVTVYRVKEPAKAPRAKAEIKGRAPSKAATWVPGYWNLQGNRNTGSRAGWVWVPGRWLTPPVQAARWDPAHWGWSDDWWTWFPGHWVQPGPHGYPPSLEQDQESQEMKPQLETQ